MKIHILRGQNQIGGSIIEISTASTRLFFDIGINLDEGAEVKVPKVDGLFCGEKNCDGVFISHYHSDHVGLMPYLLPDIPVYMGEDAYNMLEASSDYRNIPVNFMPAFLHEDVSVQIGDILVTPIQCDHSAYDSYMFLIESEGKSVLYTGDFRANGRQDFSELLLSIPHVDAVIIEGTTLSRDISKRNIEEEKLEEIAENYLKKHSGPAFIMMSSMNIDRLTTACKVAESTDRLLLEDIYTAELASAITDQQLIPCKQKNIRVFTTGGDLQYQKLQKFGNAKIGKYEIAEKPFLMCVRQSMQNYLAKLNELLSFEDGVLFYAMWKGYMEQPGMQEFIKFMEDRGVKLHVLHTSGHADALTIDQLIEAADPEFIIPVHTLNAEWFDRYSDDCSVIKDNQVLCL